MIYGESVIFAREAENKEQQAETRDDVTAEVVKRVVQKMAEGDNGQDAAERDKPVARTQANNDKRAANQFNEGNGNADSPERPHGEKGVAKWQKIFSGVLKRAKLKNFHDAGHEEDQAENEAGEEESPRAIKSGSHRRRGKRSRSHEDRFTQKRDQLGKQEKRNEIIWRP
jgi:hypothetical protein